MTNPDFFSRFKSSTEQGMRSFLSRLRSDDSLAKEGPANAAFLDWKSVNQVGVPQIDDQHRLLVDLINRLHQALVLERNRPVADELFDCFIQAARSHFRFEEAALMQQRCPGYEDHLQQHLEAMAKVQDFQRQFKVGSVSAPALLAGLRNWMLSHTKGSDIRHARYMDHLGHQQG